MTNRPITSLAILKVNWDERHSDHIDSFLPLFSNLIHVKKYSIIHPDTLRADFEKGYGLSIPYHPTIAILSRLRKRGFITRTQEGYLPDYTKIDGGNFDIVSAEQTRKLNKLVLAIVDFGKTKYNVPLKEDDVEKALLEFFRDSELSIIYATNDEKIFPAIAVDKSTKFLIAKFIHLAKNNEPTLFDFIIDIAIGSALSAAVVYGNELGEHFGGRMKNINFYLDTGYLFSLLGMDAKENKQAFEELTQNLINDGAKIKIFEHTYDEMMAIFSSALHWMNQKSYEWSKASRTLRYFITNDFSETDVEMFIARVPQILEKFKIEKIPKPDYNKHIEYQIDESAFRKVIIDAYKDDPYFDENQKKDTIDKDIESVYSICKLRHGKVPFTISEAGHVFITTNITLAKLSGHVQENEYCPFSIPPCVTDVFIGTLLWLQNPDKAVELNEKKIIADAYAAIQPDQNLVKKYLAQIEILKNDNSISENDYFILRTSRVAFNLLSEATKNDPNNFAPKTTTQILDEINKDHISLLKEIANKEKITHNKTKESLVDREKVIKQKEEEASILIKQNNRLLNFVANLLTWFILPVIVAFIIIALIINQFPTLIPSPIVRIIAFFVVTALVIFGISIKNTRVWLNDKIKSIIKKNILEK